MTKVIATFDNRPAASAALKVLQAAGIGAIYVISQDHNRLPFVVKVNDYNFDKATATLAAR